MRNGESRDIMIEYGQFSPNGIISSPIQLQSGDFIGIVQPTEESSSVRLFYTNESAISYRKAINAIPVMTSIGINDVTESTSTLILLTVVTGKFVIC